MTDNMAPLWRSMAAELCEDLPLDLETYGDWVEGILVKRLAGVLGTAQAVADHQGIGIRGILSFVRLRDELRAELARLLKGDK